MRRADTQDGFILATTLLVMTLLTVMLAAAFVIIAAESRTTGASYGSTRALAIAEAGLESYFAQPHNLTSGYDSVDLPFPGGYAQVVARKLRDSTATVQALWAVVATGVDTSVSVGRARRTIARLASLDAGALPARAAMVAANPVLMTGVGTNPIDGTDFHYAGCGSLGRLDTVGLAVAAGEYGNENVGTAPTRGIEYLASERAVADSTRIDWARLIAGQFTPDFVNELPPAGNATYYTHYFPDPAGVVQIPAGQRRGFLVTQGDVQLQSGAHWDGIILAGGLLDGDGNYSYTVHGMIITGMNVTGGRIVPQSRIRRYNPLNPTFRHIIQWDRCYATSSIRQLGFLIPRHGTTMESWKAY